jgi:hypothetical protein
MPVRHRILWWVVQAVVYIASLQLAGMAVFWLFRATGNWDYEGADIAIYPGVISILVGCALGWSVNRAVRHLVDSHRTSDTTTSHTR